MVSLWHRHDTEPMDKQTHATDRAAAHSQSMAHIIMSNQTIQMHKTNGRDKWVWGYGVMGRGRVIAPRETWNKRSNKK